MKIISEGFILGIVDFENYHKYYELIDNNKDRLKGYFPKTIKAVQNSEMAKDYLKKMFVRYSNKEIYPFGVYINEELIGWISIKNIDWEIGKGELAYYVDKSNQGHGIISKAVKEIVNFSFSKLELEKLFIRTGPDNVGSKKIALKNGFKEEGVLRNEFRIGNGELIDTIYYGLLRREV